MHISRSLIILIAVFGLVLVLIGIIASVSVGAADIKFSMVIKALLFYDGSEEHMIVRELRLPRALIGTFVGMNLAVAGAIMQGITRNPLASPQIFGINAGASLVVVTGLVLIPGIPSPALVYLAFLGSAIGGLFVYSISAVGGGMTPVKLALAGMAVHLFLTSFTEGLILFYENSTSGVLFWLAGAIDGRDWSHVKTVLPWTLMGFSLSLFLSRPLSILSLGENVAKGLGQKNHLIYLISGIVVIMLAGTSVAVAGPIGFVGLIIPHIVRSLVGVDYSLIIPFSALLGALLLIYADVLSRFITYPFESPVGIVTGRNKVLLRPRQGSRRMIRENMHG